MKLTEKQSCLFIGNTRWHWAIKNKQEWRFFHTYPDLKRLQELDSPLSKWAAVGPVPNVDSLKQNNELVLRNIPLLKLPRWLGVDRALAGWAALKRLKSMNVNSRGVLIGDAGTILTITRFTAKGEFDGGQLIAGLSLQRSAMENRTKNLQDPGEQDLPKKTFPFSTDEAILRGSFQSLLGALIEAQKEVQLPLFLCGGDAPRLYKTLNKRNINVYHYPNLVLEGMVDLIKPSIHPIQDH